MGKRIVICARTGFACTWYLYLAWFTCEVSINKAIPAVFSVNGWIQGYSSMLKQKIAFITGASRGIGQAILRQLGQNNATVIGTATTEEGVAGINRYISDHNLNGIGLLLNVTDKAAIDLTLKTIEETYGSMPDILINNAGITRDNLLLRMKEDEWAEVINTNLNAVFYLTKACLKSMLKTRWGRIVTISSVAGYMGNAGQTNYAAAKAGVVGFSKSLAREIASRNVTVNVVAPGLIDTDMTKAIPEAAAIELLKSVPMGRVGNVDEVAAAVLFLSSSAASYITGETLHVNGGMYM